MSSLTASQVAKAKPVGMAQIVTLRGDESAMSVLGSCIGLVLYDPKNLLASFAHIMLPEKFDREAPDGKYADSAIPAMLEQLAQMGALRNKLTAKIAGGANMFGNVKAKQIGSENHQAVKKILHELRIPIIGECVGGNKGYRVTFKCKPGSLSVEIVGEQVVTL